MPVPLQALPAAVEIFLAAGESPIVFTLGSAAVHIADDFFAQSARAAQRLGRRALLVLGQNVPPPDLPPTILACDYLPYAQIFPHAAAIVHQGGVGTTAQALRAGRPMLVVPFAHDQPDNAARVTRLGVARTLPRWRYRAPQIARELAALLGDASVTRAAADIGQTVRAERGVAAACDALEKTLRPA
jgi:UDP:flavonoid glycosyltransferase YjiC (YdhE family)